MDKESLINKETPSASSSSSQKETLSEFSILRILCILLTVAATMLVALTLVLFLWTSIGGEYKDHFIPWVLGFDHDISTIHFDNVILESLSIAKPSNPPYFKKCAQER